MPLVRMPNGEYVNIADGTPPDVVARIRAQYPAKAQSAAPRQPNAIDTRKAEVDRIVQERAMRRKAPIKALQGFSDAVDLGGDNLASTYTLGITDAMDAGGSALKEVFKGKNFREQYNLQKDAIKQERASFAEANPIVSGVGTVAGMVANPLGAETGIGKGLVSLGEKIAPVLTKDVLSSGAVKLADRAANSAIGLGARAGFNQGAVTGAVDSLGTPEDLVSNVLNQGGMSAAAGAAGGAAVAGLGKAYNIFKDRSAGEGSRVAYTKIADLLDNSSNPATKKPFTAKEAENEMKVAAKAGNDPMLMDIDQGMTDTGAYLANSPKFPLASEMAVRAEDRASTLSDRFNAKVQSIFSDIKNPNAFTRKKQIQAERKAAAEVGFSDDVMKKPFSWSDELNTFFTKRNPIVQDALKRAEKLVRGEDIDPVQLGWKYDKDGNMIEAKVPNMFVFDKVRKGFNEAIGEALRGGNRETARMYSMQLTKLKDAIGNVNSEYSAALKAQRDLFQKEESVDMGENFIKALRTDSRKLLEDIQKQGVDKKDLRLGVVDAMLRLHEKGDNPIKLLRAAMRSDDQRKVLRYLIGSNKTLNDFEKFMRREIRQRETDDMLSSRVRNRANLLRDNPDADAGQGVANVAKSALQGAAFGGPIGAGSRALREFDILSRGMGPEAKLELAKLLMGRGKGLEKGVDSAKKYAERRAARTKKLAATVGKVAGGSVTGFAQE